MWVCSIRLMMASDILLPLLNRNLVFVHGKGGVGKTAVSKAIALSLARKKENAVWITLSDPVLEPGALHQIEPYLWHLNCDFTQSFEEYIGLKIGMTSLARLFLKNSMIRYLAKAAPGIQELVLLGKIWSERKNYQHVIVDMPSTGYGLALFQSTENFARLFRGGPLQGDAEAMLRTFQDPKLTGHFILALPEETPLREALELNDFLKKIFPDNPAGFLVNRLFPDSKQNHNWKTPLDWTSPIAKSAEEYSEKRFFLENYNLRLWKDLDIPFGTLPFIPYLETLVQELATNLQTKAYL